MEKKNKHRSCESHFKRYHRLYLILTLFIGLDYLLRVDFSYKQSILCLFFGFSFSATLFYYILSYYRKKGAALYQSSQFDSIKQSLSDLTNHVKDLSTKTPSKHSKHSKNSSHFSSLFEDISIDFTFIGSTDPSEAYLMDDTHDANAIQEKQQRYKLSRLKALFKKNGHQIKVLKPNNRTFMHSIKHSEEDSPLNTEFPFNLLNYN